MNRAERRRNKPPQARLRVGHGNPTPANIYQAIHCPDCHSEVTTIGAHRYEVAHDDSCPWYAQLKQDLA